MSYIEKTNIAGEDTIARFGFTKVEYFNPIKLIMFPFTWFRRWCYEFGVTNKRVVFKHGFISRKAKDLRLESIETVGISNGLIGRIFGYGNLTITGMGNGKPITVPHLANIIEVKKAIEAAKDQFVINR